MLTKLTVETALNAELTEHLGHEKNARKSGSNSRNGYSSKTVLSDDGEIEITTLGDRYDTFEPQLIKKIRPVSRKWITRFYPFMPKV